MVMTTYFHKKDTRELSHSLLTVNLGGNFLEISDLSLANYHPLHENSTYTNHHVINHEICG